MFNKKIMLIFSLILLVLSVFVFASDPGIPGRWGGGNGGDTNPPDNITTYDSTLQIIEINAEVDGKKDTIKNSEEKISREAKEESDIEFEITVKNIWDKEIKDIDVTVTIEDIDDSDDLEEDANIKILNAGDSKKVDTGFELPLKVDDGNYDVKIKVRGKDEDNNIHILDWALTLEVKKDSHNVEITTASLSPSTLSCSRTSNLQIKILNLGRNEEEVALEIKSEYLNIDFKETGIELDTGTDDDAEYEKKFRLTASNNAEAGTYPVTINAYYNKGKSLAAKNVNLMIKGCSQTEETQKKVSIKTLPPALSETFGYQRTKTPSKTTISTTSDESIVLLLTMLLVIILGLIIFLLGVIMIKLKR